MQLGAEPCAQITYVNFIHPTLHAHNQTNPKSTSRNREVDCIGCASVRDFKPCHATLAPSPRLSQTTHLAACGAQACAGALRFLGRAASNGDLREGCGVGGKCSVAPALFLYFYYINSVLCPRNTVNPPACRACTSLSASGERRGFRRSVNARLNTFTKSHTNLPPPFGQWLHRVSLRPCTHSMCLPLCVFFLILWPPCVVQLGYKSGYTITRKHSRSRTHSTRGEGI